MFTAKNGLNVTISRKLYDERPVSRPNGDRMLAPAPDTFEWYTVTSDDTGQFLAAASINNGIYTSSDYGVNWVISSNSNDNYDYQGIASDSTGQYLAAAVYGGGIYTSSNNGSTLVTDISSQCLLVWYSQ